jgi:HEAT repeat protein
VKEELLRKLSSMNKSEVREAIESLADYEEPEVVEAIVDAMIHVRSKAVLEAAKSTLSSYRNIPEVVCGQVVKLFDIEEPKLRHAAIDIMSSYGDECVDVVRDRLLSSKDYNIRKFGLDVLSGVISEKSLDAIISALHDENPNVRFTALEYLRNFSEFKDRVVDAVLEILPQIDDLYGLTTLASTLIYGNFKDSRLIEPLREKLKELKEPLYKHWIYKILVFLEDKDIYEEALENARIICMEQDIKKDLEIFGE